MNDWPVEAKIRRAFTFTGVLLLIAGGLSLLSIVKQNTNANWIVHTLEVRSALQEVITGLSEIEAGMRGYVITRDEVFLQAYQRGLARIQGSFQELQMLTQDSPSQQQRLAMLKPLTEHRLSLLQQILDARSQKGFAAAQEIIDSGRGKKMMSEVRKIVGQMESEELGLLDERIKEREFSSQFTFVAGSVFGLLTFIVLLFSFHTVRQGLAREKQIQATLDKFFNMSLDMLCIGGFDGYFKRLNSAWQSGLGYTKEELLCKPWLEFVHPEDRGITAEVGKRIMHGEEVVAFENRYQRKDGTYRVMSWNAIASLEDKTIYATARDITIRKQAEQEARDLNELLKQNMLEKAERLEQTGKELVEVLAERKKIEEQLYQSQKMEAVGRLAGGIAHDFNNLLTVILGFSGLLLENPQLDDAGRDNAREIAKAGDRAAALTRQLLTFSRRQVLQLQVMDLNHVVGEAEKMLQRLIGEDIQLKTILTPTLWRIKADPVQVQQILMNLAVNARDAMPEGGKLTIETSNVQLDEGYARQHVQVRPGPYVMLAVSDTGVGMDAETQSHVFEPFFTTKEKGKGTGLGLATVYGIVRQSEGNVYVYSEAGVGTTFKIYLPRAEGEETRPQAMMPAPGNGQERTILLAEDEPGVRALARKVLESKGFRVLEADSGETALSIAEQHEGPIHLLLTDVVMPGMRGKQLSECLEQTRPGTKVLYMSGYTDEAAVDHGMLESGVAFVPKPFTPDNLVRKIHDILG